MIVLARHGQTEWNKVKRLQGCKNSPLTGLGEEQAFYVAKKINELVGNSELNLVSSPLGRALDTAKVIASELGKSDNYIKIDVLLREYSFGDWEGDTFKQIKQKYSEQWDSRQADKWNYVVPGGESYSILARRAEKWLLNLPDNIITVAVSHQMIGQVIRGIYLGLDERQTLMNSQQNNEIILLENGSERIVKA
ncbi:MAG: broad specificity phosphatase PhoE [Motiliproteus sp.]|jgi:broad specificity phosphatase PhoE